MDNIIKAIEEGAVLIERISLSVVLSFYSTWFLVISSFRLFFPPFVIFILLAIVFWLILPKIRHFLLNPILQIFDWSKKKKDKNESIELFKEIAGKYDKITAFGIAFRAFCITTVKNALITLPGFAVLLLFLVVMGWLPCQNVKTWVDILMVMGIVLTGFQFYINMYKEMIKKMGDNIAKNIIGKELRKYLKYGEFLKFLKENVKDRNLAKIIEKILDRIKDKIYIPNFRNKVQEITIFLIPDIERARYVENQISYQEEFDEDFKNYRKIKRKDADKALYGYYKEFGIKVLEDIKENIKEEHNKIEKLRKFALISVPLFDEGVLATELLESEDDTIQSFEDLVMFVYKNIYLFLFQEVLLNKGENEEVN